MTYSLKEANVYLREDYSLYSDEPIVSPTDAIELLHTKLRKCDREYVYVINLDTAGHPINVNLVSIGTLNASYFDVPSIFKSSILANAAQIMILHNHPSGDVTPSKQDLYLTKTVIKAGTLLGIPVVDHIILSGTDKEYCSMRKKTDLWVEEVAA